MLHLVPQARPGSTQVVPSPRRRRTRAPVGLVPSRPSWPPRKRGGRGVEADIAALPGTPAGVLVRVYGLTPSEARVALLLAEGWANRAIADHCEVTEYTARRHTERVFVKLGVHRRDAVRDRVVGALHGSPIEPVEQMLATAGSR